MAKTPLLSMYLPYLVLVKRESRATSEICVELHHVATMSIVTYERAVPENFEIIPTSMREDEVEALISQEVRQHPRKSGVFCLCEDRHLAVKARFTARHSDAFECVEMRMARRGKVRDFLCRCQNPRWISAGLFQDRYVWGGV